MRLIVFSSFIVDANMSEILPNKNVLLAAEELVHLQSDDNFAFLIETIYEQISNTM